MRVGVLRPYIPAVASLFSREWLHVIHAGECVGGAVAESLCTWLAGLSLYVDSTGGRLSMAGCAS